MNAQVNNVTISYIQTGSGPVLVLLHGWGSSKETFTQLVDSLSNNFTVIALDLPGFGGSEQPAGIWQVGDYALFVRDFIAYLGIENVYAYIAHSFGGRICIKGIANGDLKCDNLILIGSAGIKHSNSLRNITYASLAKAGKAILRLPGLRRYQHVARERLYERAQSADYLNAGTMKQIFKSAINEDLKPLLKDISIPTLLVWGSEDDQTPLADARIMQKTIPTTSIRIQQRAGHFVHTEYPQKVGDWIGAFL